MTDKYDCTLDTRGLLCPEPVMLLHKKVRDVDSGSIIRVIATDPSTSRDIPKFCQFLGHELLSSQEQQDTYRYFIKKSKTDN